jgi:hypothetical protein
MKEVRVDGNYNLVLLKSPGDFIKIDCPNETHQVVENFIFVFVDGMTEEELFERIREWRKRFKSIADLERNK